MQTGTQGKYGIIAVVAGAVLALLMIFGMVAPRL